MLIQFSCKNYKVFQKQAVLSLSEARISEFSDTLLNASDGKVLPLAMLYGANGSGKSTLLQALFDLSRCISAPADVLAKPLSFAFSPEKADEPTEFELLFRLGELEYDYQLKLQNHLVKEENLFFRPFNEPSYQVLFDRDDEGIYLGTLLEGMDVATLNDDTPMLAFLKQQKFSFLEPVFAWLENFRLLDTHNLNTDAVSALFKQPELFQKFQSLLASFLPGIRALTEEQGEFFCEYSDKKIRLKLSEESRGVRHTIALLAEWLLALSKGSVLLADNPYIYLHPEIFRRFLLLFQKPQYNTNGAQLICCSHDMPTMNNQLLRRDEIWLTKRSAEGDALLYQLAPFRKENGEKVRKDEIYYKQFLEGRYGSFPHLKEL